MMNPPLCGAMALVPVFGPSLRLPKIALLLIICEGPRRFELTDSPSIRLLQIVATHLRFTLLGL